MEEGGDDTPLIHYPERGAPRYSAQRPAALLRSRKFRRTRVSTYTTPYFTCRHCNAIITVDITMLKFLLAGFDVTESAAEIRRQEALRARQRQLGIDGDPVAEIVRLLRAGSVEAAGGDGDGARKGEGEGEGEGPASPRFQSAEESQWHALASKDSGRQAPPAAGRGCGSASAAEEGAEEQTTLPVDSLAEPSLAEHLPPCRSCGRCDSFVLGAHDFGPEIAARERQEWERQRRQREAATRIQRAWRWIRMRRELNRRVQARIEESRREDAHCIHLQAVYRGHRARRLAHTVRCLRHIEKAHPVLRSVVVDSLVAEGRAFWPPTKLEEALLFRDYRALVRRMGGQPTVLEVEHSVHVVYSNLHTKEHLFAVRIQSAWRGLRARLFTRTLRVLQASTRGHDVSAAMAIQRLVRGTWGRRRAAAKARTRGVGSTLEQYRRHQRSRAQEEGAVDLRGRLYRAYTRAREQEQTSRFLGLYRPDPRRGVMASFLRSAAGRQAVDADAYRALFHHATSELQEREARGRELRRKLRWLEHKVGGLDFGRSSEGGATAPPPSAPAPATRAAGPAGPGTCRRRKDAAAASFTPGDGARGRRGSRRGPGAAPTSWPALRDEAAAEGARRAAYVRQRYSMWRVYYATEIHRVEKAFEELYLSGDARAGWASSPDSPRGQDSADPRSTLPTPASPPASKDGAATAVLRRGKRDSGPPSPRVRAALGELFDTTSLEALGIPMSGRRRARPDLAGGAGGAQALLRNAGEALSLAQSMGPARGAGTLSPLGKAGDARGAVPEAPAPPRALDKPASAPRLRCDPARDGGGGVGVASATGPAGSTRSRAQSPAQPRSARRPQERTEQQPRPAVADREVRRMEVERRVRAGKLRTLHKMALHADDESAVAPPSGGAASTFRAKRDAILKQQHVAVAYARGKEAAAALARKSGPEL